VRHFRFRQRNHLPTRFRWFHETGFSFANRMQKTAESETGFGYIWVNLKPVSHNGMRSKWQTMHLLVVSFQPSVVALTNYLIWYWVVQMISDLNTYLNKAVPDTRLTIKKYLDTKFEYLVSLSTWYIAHSCNWRWLIVVVGGLEHWHSTELD